LKENKKINGTALVEYLTKGQSPFTEFYSIFEARYYKESDDAKIKLNTDLLDRLFIYNDKIFVCGEALSHCVADSIDSMIKHCKSFENIPQNDHRSTYAFEMKIDKIHLILDCCSTIPGFETKVETKIEEWKQAGVKIVNSKDLL